MARACAAQTQVIFVSINPSMIGHILIAVTGLFPQISGAPASSNVYWRWSKAGSRRVCLGKGEIKARS